MRPRHALYVRGMHGRCLVYKPYILIPSRTPPLVSPEGWEALSHIGMGCTAGACLGHTFVAVEATVISVVIVVVAVFVVIVIFTAILAAIVIVAILVVIVVIATVVISIATTAAIVIVTAVVAAHAVVADVETAVVRVECVRVRVVRVVDVVTTAAVVPAVSAIVVWLDLAIGRRAERRRRERAVVYDRREGLGEAPW